MIADVVCKIIRWFDSDYKSDEEIEEERAKKECDLLTQDVRTACISTQFSRISYTEITL